MHATLIALSRVRRLADWRHWQALGTAAPPFLSPEFFLLASRLAGDAAFVAEACDDDRLRGALPLVRRGDRLHALQCEYSPAFDYLGDPAGLEAIWRALRAEPGWNELVLKTVPVSSPLASCLPALAIADGCPAVVRRDSSHRYLPLAGFEAALAAKFRSNLHRCARKAGTVELETLTAPDREDFDDALRIEAMAWKGAAATSIDTDARATHLYRALARLFGRRRQSTLYFLRIQGTRVATLLTVESATTLFALKIGYAPAFAALSPGHLLVWKVAAAAEARGLTELDFVGRDDEWKRRWTDRVHEHVAVTIYRDSPRGLARYAARHLLRPHLPVALRGGLREAIPRGCQRADVIGTHRLLARVYGRVRQGLGIKSGLERLVRPPPARDPLGTPSAFAAGSWVRVKPADELRALLSARDRTRGLAFTAAQWSTSGSVHRVERVVRGLRDDRGMFRPVDRTVLLTGVSCAGDSATPAGCGRHCPMLYRDEWLEPAPAPPAPAPPAPAAVRHARVRSLEEIRAGLDLRGRRDGLTFMPEMAAYASRRYAVASAITRVFEYDRWVDTPAPVYVLDGLHCTGAVVAARGPCDRACALLWHADWLVLGPEPAPA